MGYIDFVFSSHFPFVFFSLNGYFQRLDVSNRTLLEDPIHRLIGNLASFKPKMNSSNAGMSTSNPVSATRIPIHVPNVLGCCIGSQ